jgi:hypothetical protein
MSDQNNFWTKNPSLNLPRGKEKTAKYREIIVATLRSIAPTRPTKDELQRKAHIKRCRFVVILNELIESGTILREGMGTRGDQYRYRIADPLPASVAEFGV